MNVVKAGHIYELENRMVNPHAQGKTEYQTLTFVNLEPGQEASGVITQEVLRVLIDRTKYCDLCLPWDGNQQIIYHLRMALALHEARALVRKTHKGLMIEFANTGKDGNIRLSKISGKEVESSDHGNVFNWAMGIPSHSKEGEA